MKSFNYIRTLYRVKSQVYTRVASLPVLSLQPNLGPHCYADKPQMVECSAPNLLLSRSISHLKVPRHIA